MVTDFAVLGDRFILRAGVRDAALTIDLSSSDSFLRDVIGSEPIRIPFDLVLGIDSTTGFFVEGGTGLTATLPVNRSLAGLRIDHIALALKFPDRSAFRLEVTAALGLSLGPFQASVDQLGYALDVDFKGGNLAIANVDSRFQPPRGVGLTLGFEKARGGGYLFLDPDKGEYAGVLQIDFGRSSLTAIGILTTKGVPGTDNWALLMIVFAKTAAPTPGLGFVLTGFGGVIGVNHAVDEEAFRNGLRTKALDDVLFPKDPVANASRILATLRSVFPATGDKAIVGIAAEFSYLASKRVVIRIGVIVQFGESGPERIVILGQLKVSAPGEKNGLLSLNADLFGDVQWGEKQVRIAIDTRLYDSKIGAKGAEFVITGSLSIRVTLGCNSMFLLTAGGFRPDFEAPAELHLPAKLDRFGFKLDQGIARITLAGYFAITPCTVQLGVEVELVAKKFGFSVEVRAAIHALLDEVEGRFVVDLELSAALKRGSTTLMKIELKLTVGGPGPWRAAGSAKFKLLFFSKTISFDCEWGAELSTVVQAIDAAAGLAAELAQPANWGALPAGTALVSLVADTTSGLSLIHPVAELTVQQRLRPARDADRPHRRQPGPRCGPPRHRRRRRRWPADHGAAPDHQRVRPRPVRQPDRGRGPRPAVVRADEERRRRRSCRNHRGHVPRTSGPLRDVLSVRRGRPAGTARTAAGHVRLRRAHRRTRRSGPHGDTDDRHGGVRRRVAGHRRDDAAAPLRRRRHGHARRRRRRRDAAAPRPRAPRRDGRRFPADRRELHELVT